MTSIVNSTALARTSSQQSFEGWVAVTTGSNRGIDCAVAGGPGTTRAMIEFDDFADLIEIENPSLAGSVNYDIPAEFDDAALSDTVSGPDIAEWLRNSFVPTDMLGIDAATHHAAPTENTVANEPDAFRSNDDGMLGPMQGCLPFGWR